MWYIGGLPFGQNGTAVIGRTDGAQGQHSGQGRNPDHG